MILFKWIGALFMGLGMLMIFSYFLLPFIGTILTMFVIYSTFKDKGLENSLECFGAVVVAMIVQNVISLSLMKWLFT